jgi:hypothetical protein
MWRIALVFAAFVGAFASCFTAPRNVWNSLQDDEVATRQANSG